MSPLIDLQGGRVIKIAAYYAVVKLLGTGRFSEVYKAYDELRHIDVALKVYLRADVEGHTLADSECKTLRRLASVNTGWFPKCWGTVKWRRTDNRTHKVVVLELGEYVGHDGSAQTISLQNIIPRPVEGSAKPLRPDEEFWELDCIQQWILALASAVQVMHEQQVIHRDLKPANIIVKRAAGSAQSMPLFLDFNCSIRQGQESFRGGTQFYLPPEVRSGKRLEPSEQDDLWAIALVAWQLLHGAGTSPEEECSHLHWLSDSPRETLLHVLRRALLPDAASRFRSAKEFKDALEAVLIPKRASPRVPTISADEFGACRADMERLRFSIEETLAGKSEFVVPKSVADQVLTLYAWLAEGDTQSLDMVAELVRLGPRAISVAIENGHRLRPESDSYRQVLEALEILGKQDPDLAEKAITAYALSSNLVVRAICREFCGALNVFPVHLLEQLAIDEGILLPQERVDLVDLCIRFCPDQTAILSLTKYMCREYIRDQSRYDELRERIAVRMGSLPFPERALLVVEDTVDHIWEDLNEFESIPSTRRGQVANGLLQLMADAFGSMGDEGHSLLVRGRVPRESKGTPPLRILRVFARKLQRKHGPTKNWLENMYQENPEDADLAYALGKKGKINAGDIETLRDAFDRYVTDGSKPDLNTLRFTKRREVFQIIAAFLEGAPSSDQIRAVLSLLEGFEHRHRAEVVECLLKFWNVLGKVEYLTTVDVLTRYRIRDPRVGEMAIRFLEEELLRTPDRNRVRNALDQLLEWHAER